MSVASDWNAGPVLLVAEAGVNHNGDLGRALELVDAAARAGADAVKFQTFRAEALATARAAKADYQAANDGAGGQLDMLRRLELDEAAHRALLERCRERAVLFLSTPFDLESVDLLAGLGMELFKIPSGEITNVPYLRRVGALGRRVVLSTGMAELEEVGRALDVLAAAGTPREAVVVLHCTTEYPAPLAEVNLRAMAAMGRHFGVATGYSDHTRGIAVSVAAAALGARLVEKHFTLDRTLPGPDHQASLEPDELAELVRSVRAVELALGDGIKRPMPSELANRERVRKSIVAARPIARGEAFTEAALACKRPATGLSPLLWDALVGRPAGRDYAPDEPIDAAEVDGQ